MSGWRIAVSSLHSHGGGPLKPGAFDCDTLGLRRARELGLVWHVNGTHWQLTAKGRAVAEGRACAVERRTGRQGRGGLMFVATWISALPRPNEIRLCGAIPVSYP